MNIALRSLTIIVSVSGIALAGVTLATAAGPVGKPATGVVCQLAKSGNVVHVEALNKGPKAVAAGDSFSFTILGPTKKTDETITFKKDLAPGKSVSVTNAIKAKNVVGCTPAV